MIKVICFDADGTLTKQREHSIDTFTYTMLPNVQAKCKELQQSGLRLAIASNQGGAHPSQENGRSVGDVMQQLTWTAQRIGAEYFTFAICRDGPRYKPQPGMLIEVAEWFSISIAEMLYIGDQKTDELAALAAGCKFQYASKFFA